MTYVLRLKYLSYLITTIVITVIYFFILTYFNVINLSTYQIVFFSLLGSIVFSFAYIIVTGRFQEPQSYYVAILGFPKSGKTTLIISLFGEAFARRLPVKMMPKGEKTIDMVNQSLSLLERGRSLGPTQDQDRFSFRGEVIFKEAFFSKKYNVEFGDFPGHDSKQYMEEYGPWLHKTEFFKWVSDSDALIFVIDLSHYINPRKRSDYISEMSSAIRAAWQHFVDINEYRINRIRRIPIILAFNKADLFSIGIRYYGVETRISPTHIHEIEEKIMNLGFGNIIPEIKEIQYSDFIDGKDKVINDFNNIIKYLKNESNNVHVIFTSSFGLYQGIRLGIRELFISVLPK